MTHVKCEYCERVGLAGTTCGFCGSNRLVQWPAPEVVQLLTNIGIGYHPLGHIDLQDPTPHRIGVMLTAIAFERLLEELLYLILYGDSDYNETAVLVEALMEAHEGRARMLTLFKKVAHGSFAHEAAAVGYPGFSQKWDELARERNLFVHGERRRTDSTPNPIDLHHVGIEGLNVFRELTNVYAPHRL